MKKQILLGLLAIPIVGFAQTSNNKEVTQKANVYNVPVATDSETNATSTSSGTDESVNQNKQAKVQNYSAVKIGETYYDLQTNASIGRRVVLHADGTVSAVWTTSNVAANGWPNRGSGYNHYDGSSWSMVSSERIESSTRTGWPSIGVLDGKEFVISHESSTGGFGISMNGSIGSNSWSTEKALDDERTNENRVPIWGRAASGGDYIHLISNYWFSEDNNVPRVFMNGVGSPTTYTRMYKGPDSIEVFHSTLPGYDTTRLTFGGGDSYAIDVKDSVVAIAIGGRSPLHSVYLWKSTDYGKTWDIMDVDKYPYYGNLNGLYGDTLFVNDGSVDVMIDDNNYAHVAWGGIRVTENDTTDDEGTYVFYPYQAGLFHWSEEFDVVNRCGALIDADMNGEQNINEETITALNANGEIPTGLDGSSIPFFAARYGGTGIISHPSLSMDANGNMFVVYSAPIEYDIHPRQANYRDILVSYSDDGGQTWYGPQNIVQSRGFEDVFGCVAKRSNDFLHLIYQTDVIPGTHLQNDGTAGLHPNDKCDINYIAVPVSDILNDVIGQNTLNTEEVYKEENVFVVSQNYPNPFNGSTEVVIYLRDKSNINVTITDVAGKVISTTDFGNMSAGNHSLELDATGFRSGVYFYTVQSGSNAVTRKMQVY